MNTLEKTCTLHFDFLEIYFVAFSIYPQKASAYYERINYEWIFYASNNFAPSLALYLFTSLSLSPSFPFSISRAYARVSKMATCVGHSTSLPCLTLARVNLVGDGVGWLLRGCSGWLMCSCSFGFINCAPALCVASKLISEYLP